MNLDVHGDFHTWIVAIGVGEAVPHQGVSASLRTARPQFERPCRALRSLRSIRSQIRMATIGSLSVLALTGCEVTVSNGSRAGGAPISQAMPAQRVRSDRIPNRILLEHDFGLVAAGESRQHEFVIENPTATQWTIRSVQSSCSCTVAKPESDSIPAGSRLRFPVAYQSPHLPVDDVRHVTIAFREATAPVVQLTVAAQVRRALSIRARELSFGSLIPDARVTQRLLVENFSSETWTGLKVRSPADWLSFRCVESPAFGETLRSMSRRPAQYWEVEITADASGKDAKLHAATIEFEAEGSRKPYTDAIAVSMRVTGPFKVTPTSAFFGRIPPRHVARQTVQVMFSPGVTVPAPETVSLEHTSGGRLVASLTPITPRRWQVNVELQAKDRIGRFTDTLTLRSQQDDSFLLRIPVLAEVVE